MSGYTPAFSDIYMGTLYGRWPAAAVWASLLPLFDKNGVIDMSLQAISGMTGWPLDLLEEGINQLMSPDPSSRTPECEGRRLVALDTSRPWGWRAVNHAKYREKARLMAKNQREVESGQNRERLTAAHRRSPPETASQTHTQTQTHTQEKNARSAREPPPAGLDLQAWNRWEAYRREIRKPIKPASVQAAQRRLAGFGADQAAVVEQSIAQGWTGLFELKAANGNGHAAPRKTRYEQSQEILRDATES